MVWNYETVGLAIENIIVKGVLAIVRVCGTLLPWILSVVWKYSNHGWRINSVCEGYFDHKQKWGSLKYKKHPGRWM